MKKRSIAVRPTETLAIELPDKTVEVVFNMDALMTFTEEFGNISKVVNKFYNKPYELSAMPLGHLKKT